MPFCACCGNQHGVNVRFCQNCGQPIEPIVQAYNNAAPQAAPFSAPPAPSQFANEPVLVIVPNLQLNNPQGIRDSYYLIVTQSRSLFIKINPLITQKALQKRQDKNHDKGFFGRWKEQVAGPDMYLEYFQALTPGEMFRESPESFFIDNLQVQQVVIKYYFREDYPSEWYLGFQAAGNVINYVTNSDPEKLLISAYPGRVFKQK